MVVELVAATIVMATKAATPLSSNRPRQDLVGSRSRIDETCMKDDGGHECALQDTIQTGAGLEEQLSVTEEGQLALKGARDTESPTAFCAQGGAEGSDRTGLNRLGAGKIGDGDCVCGLDSLFNAGVDGCGADAGGGGGDGSGDGGDGGGSGGSGDRDSDDGVCEGSIGGQCGDGEGGGSDCGGTTALGDGEGEEDCNIDFFGDRAHNDCNGERGSDGDRDRELDGESSSDSGDAGGNVDDSDWWNGCDNDAEADEQSSAAVEAADCVSVAPRCKSCYVPPSSVASTQLSQIKVSSGERVLIDETPPATLQASASLSAPRPFVPFGSHLGMRPCPSPIRRAQPNMHGDPPEIPLWSHFPPTRPQTPPPLPDDELLVDNYSCTRAVGAGARTHPQGLVTDSECSDACGAFATTAEHLNWHDPGAGFTQIVGSIGVGGEDVAHGITQLAETEQVNSSWVAQRREDAEARRVHSVSTTAMATAAPPVHASLNRSDRFESTGVARAEATSAGKAEAGAWLGNGAVAR
eukprot:5563830-Pleurochrysis_carterae.AAC.1